MKSILKQLGYVGLAYPNPTIKPLAILERTNNNIFKFFTKAKLENLHSDLFDIFEEDGILPKVKKPVDVPEFGGQDLLENKAGLQAKLLEKMGFAGNAQLASKLENATKFLYEFKNPQKFFVNSVTLSEFVNSAKLKNENSDSADKVKQGVIYVVTEILVTKNMKITDGSSFEIGGELSGDVLAEATLKVEANHNNESARSLTYENEKPIVFALKVKQIFYDKDKRRFSMTDREVEIVRGHEDDDEMNIDENFIILES